MVKVLNVDIDMLIFGIRYAIGRRTFAPTIAVENVKLNIERLDNSTIDIIIRDIKNFPGSLGDECDKVTWMDFINYLEDVKSKRKLS